ncbi:MAG: energy-dependent translational throttle protein EttA [Alphaproteobacteria bacterium]|nr:energy-dependent translational throttle protein EttA [Alphaproteobacteria bacterium]
MPAYQYIYVMKNLSKSYAGGKEVLKGIWLSFFPGAKIGVLGPNGAGKSTLLKIMAGLDKEFNGEAWAADGVRIGFLEQEPHLDPTKNVLENVMDGVGEVRDLLKKFEEVNLKFADPDADMDALLAEQAALQEAIEAKNGWELEHTLNVAMHALNCPAKDADVTKLSGGERRRVALCRLLLSQPDMLLLDEPTNHLDASSVAWLEQYLREFPGTVVMITHDRYFLDNVTGWILELDRGQGIPYEGNYTAWLKQKEKRLTQEQREDDSRQRTIRQELEWISKTPQARQVKSKARVTAYNELVAKSAEKATDTAQIVIPAGQRLGDLVIKGEGICKAYGSRVLMKDLSFNLPAGGIVGIIGPNGVGKTTLLRMVTGQESPDAGDLKIGDTVQMGYVDQSRDALKADATVWQEISGGDDEIVLGKRKVNSRAYVASFNFKGGDQQKKVGQLSGGERNRVHLAKMLKSGANVLLLDEPTNDLDVDTLRALEEALMDFAGSVVITSHDRWFLDRLATHILAFEGDGQVVWFEGNYDSYEADLKRRKGDKTDKIKFRKLGV